MKLGDKITNPGEMRTKAALYARTVSTETGGFQVPGRTLLANLWVKWTNFHGSEALAVSSMQAEAAATVLMRYQADVDTTCLIEKGGVYYEIISLDDIQERHEYIELKVKRWQSG